MQATIVVIIRTKGVRCTGRSHRGIIQSTETMPDIVGTQSSADQTRGVIRCNESVVTIATAVSTEESLITSLSTKARILIRGSKTIRQFFDTAPSCLESGVTTGSAAIGAIQTTS